MRKTHHPTKESRPFYYYGEFDPEKVYVTNKKQIACISYGESYWFGAVDTGKNGKSGKELGTPSASNENWRLPKDEDLDLTSIKTAYMLISPATIGRRLTLGD